MDKLGTIIYDRRGIITEVCLPESFAPAEHTKSLIGKHYNNIISKPKQEDRAYDWDDVIEQKLEGEYPQLINLQNVQFKVYSHYKYLHSTEGIRILQLITLPTGVPSYELTAETALAEAKSYRELLRESSKILDDKNEEIRRQRNLLLQHSNILITQSDKLAVQRKLLLESNKYALLVQDAVLQRQEELAQVAISAMVKEVMVLFKPKENVSGDFYWYHKTGLKQIFVVGDCTGRGIPGSIFTLMARLMLYKIIVEDVVTAPGEVLNQLHLSLRRRLRQEQSNNRDAIEIGICILDFETQELLYAGAGIPLLFMGTHDDEFRMLRGDRAPVGGLRKESSPAIKTYRAPLKEVSHLYLFTDGFQDQVGGPEKRKYTSKKLRAFLHDIKEMPMRQQQDQLLNELNKWLKGRQEQLDDILVFGLRLNA